MKLSEQHGRSPKVNLVLTFRLSVRAVCAPHISDDRSEASWCCQDGFLYPTQQTFVVIGEGYRHTCPASKDIVAVAADNKASRSTCNRKFNVIWNIMHMIGSLFAQFQCLLTVKLRIRVAEANISNTIIFGMCLLFIELAQGSQNRVSSIVRLIMLLQLDLIDKYICLWIILRVPGLQGTLFLWIRAVI